MNAILTSVCVCACLFGAIFVGTRLRRLLPEDHFSSDTKDSVKLAMGLVATMTALLLGMLVSSAKSAYDTTRGEVLQMAAKVGLLDRILNAYGREAAEARACFRAAVAGAVERMWPEDGLRSPQLAPDAQSGDEFYGALQRLSPKDDTQRGLKEQAVTLAEELRELRYLLLAQSVPSISQPLLIAVVSWLVVIFLSFSLIAPPNATANAASLISALSVSGAILLLMELDRPFVGLVKIPNEALFNTFSDFVR
jgi:hypothetical protein